MIRFEQVSKTYPGGFRALEKVSFHLERGEMAFLTGHSGAGKSTLLKLLLGLLQPQAGHIQILGQPPQQSRQQLGYVPQHPNFSRDFPITVEQVVRLGQLGMPKQAKPQQRQAINQALAEVEAGQLAQRQIGSLSGGQLQRVLLARALVSNPKILLLDEPTANIDQRLESDIFDLLKRLNARMAILVVSHDVGFVSTYVNRVACINRTLVCHQTDAIDGQVIQSLYGDQVRMVAHHHH